MKNLTALLFAMILAALTIPVSAEDKTATDPARLEVAREFAAHWGKTVVLKGAYTVVSEPQGKTYVLNLANPGLSSAGTGDVLSGAIGGLLAQNLSPFYASCLGVYAHGGASEKVREREGNMGMIASDLLPCLPLVLKELKNVTHR